MPHCQQASPSVNFFVNRRLYESLCGWLAKAHGGFLLYYEMETQALTQALPYG